MRIFILCCYLLFPVHAVAAQVLSVLDGDTLLIQGLQEPFKVRLYGIDCPEKDQAFGMEALNITRFAVEGKEITLLVHSTDKYGRTVATVKLDSNQTLQGLLLQSGVAWVYPQFCKSPLPCLYWQGMEWAAKWNKVGLWAQDTPVSPWQWRLKK